MSNEEIVSVIRAGGDRRQLMGLLYDQNRRLIAKWANQWKGRAEFEDLMQEGYLALIAAVDAYDESKGYKFTTYLTKAVWRHFARLYNGAVRLPEWLKDDIAAYRIQCRLHEIETGNKLEDQLAAARLQWTPGHVEIVKRWSNLVTVSLDAPITKEADSAALESVIPDPDNGIDDLIDDVSDNQMKDYVWSVVDSLPADQSQIIRWRYQDGKTREDMSKLNGKSAAQIASLESKGMRALRRPTNSKRLEEALDYYGIGCHASGLSTFRKTGMSSVELAVIKKDLFERHPELLKLSQFAEK